MASPFRQFGSLGLDRSVVLSETSVQPIPPTQISPWQASTAKNTEVDRFSEKNISVESAFSGCCTSGVPRVVMLGLRSEVRTALATQM